MMICKSCISNLGIDREIPQGSLWIGIAAKTRVWNRDLSVREGFRIASPESNSESIQKQVERWFLELREPVFRYLRAMGCPPWLAEEITQESFLRLHRAFRLGLQVNDVRAWVFRVARNLYIDSRREYQRYWCTGVEAIGPPGLQHGDPRPNPEQQVLERERVRLIEQEVSHLPKLQRECVQLRVQGLRYHEIAAALGISMATAVDCVRRAVKRLGRRFEF